MPEPASFTIGSDNVDPSWRRWRGCSWSCRCPARFLVNAANARWGSFYDALYGTDAITGAARM